MGRHFLDPVVSSVRHAWHVKYILVLQWLGDSEADFDALIAMEDRLGAALRNRATVDGHDFGAAEMNIFLETDLPAEAFAEARVALRACPRADEVRAAYREAAGDAYTVLWPPDLTDFAVK